MPVRPDPDPQHRMKLLPYTDVLNVENQKIAAPYNTYDQYLERYRED